MTYLNNNEFWNNGYSGNQPASGGSAMDNFHQEQGRLQRVKEQQAAMDAASKAMRERVIKKS